MDCELCGLLQRHLRTCPLARARFHLRARACMLALARSRALALTALAPLRALLALVRSRARAWLVAHARTLARSVSEHAGIYLPC